MFDVVMPKMGESITEGTVLEWKKSVGDSVAKDETLLEISTDKVDSEIPSPASGTILEIIAQVNDTIPVGNVIARIGDADDKSDASPKEVSHSEHTPEVENKQMETTVPDTVQTGKPAATKKRFYSPLVKSIAAKEKVTQKELDFLSGSGKNGRVNKMDLLTYLKTRTMSSSGSDKRDSTISFVLSVEQSFTTITSLMLSYSISKIWLMESSIESSSL